MRSSKLARVIFAGVLVPPMLVVSGASAAVAQAPGPWKASSISPQSRVVGQKAETSRLAQTDRSLLGRTDATPVSVMVKLDYDALATYTGGINGFTATSPSATGKDLTGQSAAEVQYGSFVNARESAIVKEMKRRVPTLAVSQSLRTVYGGVAATVPANRISDLLKVGGVVAVQKDQLRKPDTDASPHFIGADSIYPSLGGTANSGKGVIFGVLDTGVWPEHPGLADQGNLPAPPGPARVCNFGDNPLTPAPDPFVCNHKLIGGRPFLATYLSNPARAAAEPYHTARDSNGHGTHTSTTAAGNVLASATVLGVQRGPLNGIAPGAWVSAYKVCGIQGCFDSDSAAAVAQAILDGVKVINFSISGGTDPFTDPVELAFLDAYAAGIFVAASAGNDGPGAATVNHVSPWVTTVAASTQKREFDSNLTLHGTGSNTLNLVGASITAGAGPAPVVLAQSLGGYSSFCTAPAPAGSFTGKIVACQRGVNARVDKGFNVKQGGAVGMILYNPTLADTETDNHWLPTVHLADGTSFVAFMAANPSVTGSFTAGVKVNGPGDVMAAFSSRGPGGLGIKPDITAPGVQILAGHTPTPESITNGPPGELFQAIAGTSMSSPHIAGSAILLRALRPSWTPGQVKSAMMTTAEQDVVKEDGTTAADPFDYGSGRVNLHPADNPVLLFDETAARMAALGNNPLTAINLNIPSINAPVMPGVVTTTRTAKNITNKTQPYHVTTSAPAGSSITVTPSVFSLNAGQSVTLTIVIASSAPTAQYFGEIVLHGDRAGVPNLHLPVAFVPQQGRVSLTSACSPSSVAVGGSTTCTINAQNNSSTDTTADFATVTNARLNVTGATNATVVNSHLVTKTGVALNGQHPGVPSVAPGASPGGFIPLALFGVTPVMIGDEDIINFNVPSFVYTGVSYNRIGVDSNGYLVVGGGTSTDNNCCNLLPIPNVAPPNNVLAPFWTDLDGTGAPGIYAATLTDGVSTWIVIEWQVNVFGTSSNRHFQIWLGIGGTQDISFTYDPAALPGDPNGQDYLVGAENADGTGGDQEMPPGLPTTDLRVTSTAPTPGGSVTYTVTAQAVSTGTGTVTTAMTTPIVPGVTVVNSNVAITPTSNPNRAPQ